MGSIKGTVVMWPGVKRPVIKRPGDRVVASLGRQIAFDDALDQFMVVLGLDLKRMGVGALIGSGRLGDEVA